MSQCSPNAFLQKIYIDEVQHDASLSSKTLPISIIFSTDCNDYWCSIFKVIRYLLCQLLKNTSIMHHSLASYLRINVHFYSEDDGVECMLSCITLCSRSEMNL